MNKNTNVYKATDFVNGATHFSVDFDSDMKFATISLTQNDGDNTHSQVSMYLDSKDILNLNGFLYKMIKEYKLFP